MINELFSLSKSLKNEGISVQEWCKDYKSLRKITPKAPCIRIWLDDAGNVVDFESIDAELAKEIRKYGNNQGTFPAFNLHPFYRVTDEDAKAELQKILDEKCDFNYDIVTSWCQQDNWFDKSYDKVERCLVKKSQELIEKLTVAGQSEENVVWSLGELTSQLSARAFRISLEECVLKKLSQNQNVPLCLYLLLFGGNGVSLHEKDEGPSVSVVVDLKDWQKYKYPVTNRHTTEWLNQHLLDFEKMEQQKQKQDGIDAFGKGFVNPGKPMPNIKLSGFDVILRAMFHGQPCQFRYGQIEDGSYPISEDNRVLVKGALEWISSPKQEGITWLRGTNNEIIFAYPSKLPKINPAFVSILGVTPDKDSAQAKARFEDQAKALIKTIKGIPADELPDAIQLFALQKMDKARTKVVFTNITSPKQLIDAAEMWQEGCKNLSMLDLKPEVPFPLQVSKVVNDVWKQNGELVQGNNKVERMKDYQGIDLLLGNLTKTILLNFLHIIITQSSGLVVFLGQKLHCKTMMKNDKQTKKAGALLFSVLGLLLIKNGIRKEKYMEEKAYLLGQLLHVADELHVLYCKVVRKGEISSQLVGNSMFIFARETPDIAISQLSVRLNPYIAWAKQYQYKSIKTKDEESWKAHWYLRLFEEVTNKLALSITRTTRFDDFEKAQLFIGYMASLPKTDK